MPETILETHSSSPFLTVPELAKLLHINEKKIYQLANAGDIPGTKITGKWIFPKALIEDWVIENSHGGVLSDRLILVGSEDLFLNHVCNHLAMDIQQSALLSYSPCGTRHGLRMLNSRRADVCFMNWGATEHNARRHLGLLRGYSNAHDWVVLRCIQRSQGLIVSRKLSNTIEDCSTALSNNELRWARRNEDSGSERLLQDLCTLYKQEHTALNTQSVFKSERAAVATVNSGDADITYGTQSNAFDYQLPFIPAATVSIDLVMSRKTYFRSMVQQLLKRLSDKQAQRAAASFAGYSLLQEHAVFTLT